MWFDIAIICGLVIALCGMAYAVNEMHRLYRLTRSVLEEYDKEEVQPLHNKIRALKELLANYPELCQRVQQLSQIYREVQSKAKSYEDPLEMVARRRDP